MQPEVPVGEYLGKWTLVVGDVNTGKTTITAGILRALCVQGLDGRIAVIDLAPEIPEELAAKRKLAGAGGRLVPPPMTGVIYLSTNLEPPRLSSKSEEEAVGKAGENAKKIEKLFCDFAGSARDILFVNDISIYLQAGTAQKFVSAVEKVTTLVANGYYGEKLGGGVVSGRERKEMEALMKYTEAKGRVIREK